MMSFPCRLAYCFGSLSLLACSESPSDVQSNTVGGPGSTTAAGVSGGTDSNGSVGNTMGATATGMGSVSGTTVATSTGASSTTGITTGVGGATTGAGGATTGAGGATTGAGGATTGTGTLTTGMGGATSTTGGGTTGTGTDGGTRPLNFTFTGGERIHTFRPADANPAHASSGSLGNETNGPQRAGVNSCAPVMQGKLLVDLGVDLGGFWDWAAERGFHVFGVDFYHCPGIGEWNQRGPDHPGDCRLETFDGQDHSNAIEIDLTHSITGHLQDALPWLHEQYPEEDWAYFLNEDGTIRWSDVAFTGYSHGAQSAARIAKRVSLWRAVSRAGPRDSGCGTSWNSNAPFNASDPPYDPNCDPGQFASWLDEEPATPIEHMFGFVGIDDSQYGDIMFSMERMNYVGEPVDLDSANPPYNSNRFYSLSYGHNEFKDARFSDAMNYAFGVPEENHNGCD